MKLKSIICASMLTMMSMTPSLAADYPSSVSDDRGIIETFEQKPSKVAALTVVAADVMQAIGEKPLGVSSFNGETPEYLGYKKGDVVDFGLLQQPNFELLTENKVDLTIGITNYNAPFAEEFEKVSKLLTYDVMNFEDSFRATNLIAKVFGKEEKAQELNDEFVSMLEDAHEKSKEGQSALFIWVFGDVMYAYHDESPQGTFLKFLKTKNVMGSSLAAILNKHALATPIDAEQLLSLNPDVIFAFRAEGNDYKNNPIFSKVNAFKNNRAYHVGVQYSQPHGPIARDVIFKEMAHYIHPEIFEKPNLPGGAAVPIQFAK